MFYLAVATLVTTAYCLLLLMAHEGGNTFLETNIRLFARLALVVGFFGFAFILTQCFIYILPESTKEAPKPVILVCDGRTVAESNNGFYVNSKSGIYKDKRTTLTYTPKQGEMCQVFLK